MKNIKNFCYDFYRTYFVERISLRRSIYIAKRISFLLEAGVSLPEALVLVASQLQKRGAIIARMAVDVARGRSITEAVAESCVFGMSALPMIKIGEESGTLAQSFLALSDELEKRSMLQQKIIGAVLYPTCITCGMLVLVIVLMTFVFPKMIGVFTSLHVILPLSTQILIWTSNMMRRFGLLIGLVFLAVVVVGVLSYRRSDAFHLRVNLFLLHIPIISSLTRAYMLASISNVVSLLMSNSASLVSALSVAAETCNNFAYRDALFLIVAEISGGASLKSSFTKFPKLFPVEYCDIVSIGEQTGKLPETFAYAHTLYTQDLDTLTKSLAASVEPVLMVCIGLAIGVVAMSVVSPMYSITSHLNGT